MKITGFLRTKWQQRALFLKSCLMVTGFAYNTLAPDWQTDLCNNATKRKYFVLLNSYRTTSTLYRCLVLHCVQIIMDHPQNRRKAQRERYTHRKRECVCMSVYYQLSRRVAGCPRFWTKFCSFLGPVSHHCLWPWLPSANMLILKFSYHWHGWKFTHYLRPTGFFFENMGEFSPRTYGALNM